MKKDRCLLVSPDFPPPLVGGSLVYIKTLVENCEENFDILTSPLANDANSESINHPHKVIRSSFIVNSSDPSKVNLFFSYFFILTWVSIKMIFRSYKLVVANPGVIGNSLLFLIGKLLKTKVVGIAYAEELTIPLRSRGLKNSIKRNLIQFSYKKADGLISVCHFCKDLLTNKFGLKEQNIDVIASCLDQSKHSEWKEITSSGRRILSVGRLIERKGFHFLINAIAGLKKELPDLSLNIIGIGPMEERLSKLIIELNAQEYIHLLGSIDDKGLLSFYEKSDLFVLANYQLDNGDTEGCPSVFAEAMAHGIPIIGGKGGGVETAIIDGENGLIVEMKDNDQIKRAIKKVFLNQNLRMSMIKNGKKKLKRDHDSKVVGLAFNKSINRFIKGNLATGFQKEFNRNIPSIQAPVQKVTMDE